MIPELARHDASGMHRVYDGWPEIAARSYGAHGEVDAGGADHIVFAGMGGSGTVGDVLAAVLSKTGVHVTNVKGYLLPGTAGPGTLVVATSVSGDTDETLTALERAAGAGCRTLAVSSGGRMEEFCSRNGIEHRRVGMDHSPRASLAGYLYAVIGMLGPALPIGRAEVDESISEMRRLRGEISAGAPEEGNAALGLARWITGIPVVYYPSGLQAAAVRFKNCLQENAKAHAMAEDVIEACHNGVVAWERGSACQPVLVRGRDDYSKTRERWRVLAEHFAAAGIDFRAVDSAGGGILSKVVNLIYVLDYASIYLAALRGIDPTPVESVDSIKARM